MRRILHPGCGVTEAGSSYNPITKFTRFGGSTEELTRLWPILYQSGAIACRLDEPVEQNGERWWYGILESRAAIHDLEPDEVSPQQAQA
jgi:hypothetical protein